MGHQRKPKSVPKLDPKGNASGKRFLSYYGGFWSPEWDPKSLKKLSKNGSKKGAPKKRLVEASGGVLGASWGILVRKRASGKPGLAMEREARDYSYTVAFYGYMLRFSALANWKNLKN